MGRMMDGVAILDLTRLARSVRQIRKLFDHRDD